MFNLLIPLHLDWLTAFADYIEIAMIVEIRMQNQLWETRDISGPGFNATEILDDIQGAREAGELTWVDWNQPLRLDIRIVEQA